MKSVAKECIGLQEYPKAATALRFGASGFLFLAPETQPHILHNT